jgi:hypothetical protein
MGIDMDRLEILIDNLIYYLPTDVPFLLALIQQQEGRYIVFGLAVVISLLLVWLLLAVLRLIFFRQQHRHAKNNKKMPIEFSEETESESDLQTERTNGFSFFRKVENTDAGDLDEDPVLVAIEQEMLAIRSLYTNGQIIKDVYVSETRRLYAKAQTVKNSQSE